MNIYEELEAINFANYEKFDNHVSDITKIFDRYDRKTLFELYSGTMDILVGNLECHMTPSDKSYYLAGLLKKYLRENISNKKVESEFSHYI